MPSRQSGSYLPSFQQVQVSASNAAIAIRIVITVAANFGPCTRKLSRAEHTAPAANGARADTTDASTVPAGHVRSKDPPGVSFEGIEMRAN
jgi:hypothetical protein